MQPFPYPEINIVLYPFPELNNVETDPVEDAKQDLAGKDEGLPDRDG